MAKKTKSRVTRKPKTAYELLGRVCKAIEAEPRSYDQSLWVINRELMNEPGGLYVRPKRLQPPCGTSFCIAGHIVAQHDGFAPAANAGYGCRSRAIDILGFDDDPPEGFFFAHALGIRTPPAGTVAYARLGVKLVRAFMRKHSAHLKSRLLKGV